MPTVDDLMAACARAGVRLVRFVYCDNGGLVRGKVVPVEHLPARMASGVGLTVGMQAMNSLDQLQPIEGMGPVGEVRLVPDPATFTVLPYAPRSAAMIVDHVRLDRTPYEACPRRFLARMVARLAERGIELRCAVENEFSLARLDGDRPVPIDSSTCFSTIGMAAAAEVVDAIVAALDAQGIRWRSTTRSSATASTSCRCCRAPLSPPRIPRCSSARRSAPSPVRAV